MKKATRDDWKIEPFPSLHTTLEIDRIYSEDEFARISLGLIPQQMEDKWFIFYESPWLYLHRSWTGFCIFKVRFELIPEGAKVAEVWVNREPNQRFGTNDLQSASMLAAILLDARAGRNVINQRKDFLAQLRDSTDGVKSD